MTNSFPDSFKLLFSLIIKFLIFKNAGKSGILTEKYFFKRFHNFSRRRLCCAQSCTQKWCDIIHWINFLNDDIYYDKVCQMLVLIPLHHLGLFPNLYVISGFHKTVLCRKICLFRKFKLTHDHIPNRDTRNWKANNRFNKSLYL